ncbi:long-chain-fatty-acid--CoA ligase [Myceligenerans indicum]|uniref:Long-chain fatty acid--CoA ligase n=1 Tax=Myceligenerans indicum TaxID=2593663 RepID=A0ABS1LJL8_9MICO|nr:long-chain fatty acid--CoA ligase [Myceligenerans indicum]MBL0886416.1 long-chain fatty acid--CoA ligase [Myceligenerans indicum]
MTHQPDDAMDGAGFGTLSVASILAETARRRPDHAALHFAGTTTTYRELWDQTRAYAGALRARGIGRGDRVAMIVPNVPDFPRVYYAALALGAVVVPVHLLFKAEEIEYVLRDSGADVLVVAAPLLADAAAAAGRADVPVLTVLAPPAGAGGPELPRLEDEAAATAPIVRHEPVAPTAAATILYTSGTTGSPKGAVGSHLALVEQVHCSLVDAFDLRSDDVVFGGLPLFHAFGQVCVLNTAFRVGASVVLLPRFEPDDALALMVGHGVTVFAAVPTMYVGIIEAARRGGARPALRYAVSGGAALPSAVLEAFSETFGAQVHEGYGLTETAPIVSTNPQSEPIRHGTVGKPIWGVDVAVADAEVEGRIALLEEPGALGEVVVRGHNLMKGYLGRSDAAAEVVVDGWFRTGDLGTLDEEGVLRIVDRKKDLIIRNGYNVYPSEVEAVLARHPQVAMAAVFGLPHETHGQEVHAAVVARDGSEVDAGELVGYMQEHVAAHKYPRVVHVADSLPLGPSGKVLKRELVQQYGTG